MTNVKNIKNSQYYHKVVEEFKERSSERGETFLFNVEQARRSLNIASTYAETQ